jgi:hypothetical protein
MRTLNWPAPPGVRKEYMVHPENPGLGRSGPQSLRNGQAENES